MKVGKLPENVWKRSVRKMIPLHTFDKDGAGIGSDVAQFCTSPDNIFYVSESVMVPFCEQMGALGVYLASNAVAAHSDDIKAIMISLFLDGRTGEQFLQHVAKDAGNVSKKLNIPIAGFDVHILQGLKSPYLLSQAIAVKSNDDDTKLKDGDDIIITKWIAMSGTSMITGIKDMYDKLTERFLPKYIAGAYELKDYLSVIPEARIAREAGAKYIRALSEAGIYRGLWEMSEQKKTGLTVDLKSIPITQETVEVCNHFDVNPYILSSSGALLIVAENGEALVEKMLDNNIPAAVIGKIKDSNDKLIVNEDEKRFLTLPEADDIYDCIKKHSGYICAE